ncbi:hypothetical protein ACWGDX_13395 [Streptomyces sp. NPDC055025]
MTAARVLGAAMPLLLLTAAAAVAVLLHAEDRAIRRREARAAEQRARPPCAPCRAVLDELELHRAAVRHACCPGWWTPARTYAHHPDCTKERTP